MPVPFIGLLDDITESLITNIQGGVIVSQYNLRLQTSEILYLSDGWTALTGYTINEMEKLFNGNAHALVIPEDMEKTAQSYAEQIAQSNCYQLEYRLRHKQGGIRWVTDRGIVVSSIAGYNQNQSIITDITPMKNNEEKLRLSEARFRIATQAARAAVFEFDLTTNHHLNIENAEVVFHTSAQTLLAAYQNARLQKQDFCFEDILRLWFHPDDFAALLIAKEEMLKEGTSECETRLRQPDGGYLWCKLFQAVVNDSAGKPLHVVGYIADADEQHRRTERLQFEAERDALTGLLNKSTFRSRVEQWLVSEPQASHALLVLDVDNFKRLNDHLGHLFGDGVLMDVSDKLVHLFQENCLLGRVGGDEFVVFIRGSLTPESAGQRANELCRAFRHTYAGEKENYSISCSVGVALSEPGNSFEQLFCKADNALYRAKNHGKNRYAMYVDCADEQMKWLESTHRDDIQTHDSGNLQIKERIFELLYSSVDFSSSVNMILSLLGRLLGVSSVCIFENTQDDRFCSKIYEWRAEGVPSTMKRLQNLPVEELSFYSQFDSKGICYGADVSALPEKWRALYEPFGIQAFFHVAIMEEGVIRGFMSYSSIEGAMKHSPDLVELMTFAAKVTGTFIIKKRADESLKSYHRSQMEARESPSRSQ
ncbi:MAG: diguanylate cyclase [Clostridia bacterium]